MSGNCKTCGEEVSFVQRPDGRWYRPFVYNPELEDITVKVVATEEGFLSVPEDVGAVVEAKVHNCRSTYQAPTAPVQYKIREIQVKVNPTPEQWVSKARRLATQCPTCRAKPFEWCTRLGAAIEEYGELKQLHTTRKAI